MVQRVLIIDDEVALARNIKDYLEADGFEARACGDGETGIAAFDELPTDVVVLDLNLPGMDGLAVLELLREHDAPTRVIIITAYGNGQTASAALRAGAYDYLAKPLALSDLRRIVVRAMRESAEDGVRGPDH
jgi:two-component system, NtrC family, response regulator AtoC